MEIRVQSGALTVDRLRDGSTLYAEFHANHRDGGEIVSSVFPAHTRGEGSVEAFQTLTLKTEDASVTLYISDAQVSEIIEKLGQARCDAAAIAAQADAADAAALPGL